MGSLVFRIAGGGSSTCADGAWVTGSAVGTYAMSLNAGGVNRLDTSGQEGITAVSASGLPLGATVSSTGDGPAFSVAAWIYPTVLAGSGNDGAIWRYILSRDGAGTTGYNGWKLSMDGASGATGMISWAPGGYPSSGYNGRVRSANGVIEENEWHLVVGIWDPADSGNEVKMWVYKDGYRNLHQTSYSGLSFTPGPGDEKFVIGAQDYVEGGYLANAFMGKVDDVAIWNVALDSGATDSLWNSGTGAAASTVSSSALVTYYNFEEGAGNSTVTDRSGNGHTGTLVSASAGSC